MERYDLATITNNLGKSGFYLYSTKTLADIILPNSPVSLYKIVARLVKSKVLERIERDKYVLTGNHIDPFLFANLLYSPSYVSLESALNYHGILSQFPSMVTSITTRRPVNKKNKIGEFDYASLQKKLFFGWIKKDGYLVAEPEKALLDQIYFNSKGLKVLNWDEYDFSMINQKVLAEYLAIFIETPEYSNIRKILLTKFKV